MMIRRQLRIVRTSLPHAVAASILVLILLLGSVADVLMPRGGQPPASTMLRAATAPAASLQGQPSPQLAPRRERHPRRIKFVGDYYDLRDRLLGQHNTEEDSIVNSVGPAWGKKGEYVLGGSKFNQLQGKCLCHISARVLRGGGGVCWMKHLTRSAGALRGILQVLMLTWSGRNPQHQSCWHNLILMQAVGGTVHCGSGAPSKPSLSSQQSTSPSRAWYARCHVVCGAVLAILRNTAEPPVFRSTTRRSRPPDVNSVATRCWAAPCT